MVQKLVAKTMAPKAMPMTRPPIASQTGPFAAIMSRNALMQAP